MATVVLHPSNFPAGQSVGAYIGDRPPEGKVPQQSAAETQTVASDGSLTFTTLIPNQRYFLYGSVSGTATFETGIYADAPAGYRVGWRPNAALLENHSRDRLPGDITALTSGTLYLSGGLIVPKGMKLSSLTFFSGTTALATGTNQWFCLVRHSDATVVAVTSDDTSTAWAANTAKTLTFASAWTPDDDTPVWAGVMVAATTPPSMLGLDHNAVNAVIKDITPKLGATANTGLTTPLAVGTVLGARTTTRQQPYCYVS
jgi:hypothetical protein